MTVAVVVVGTFAGYNAGTFLHYEDSLQKSDAIFVLAGTHLERPLEAADLYKEAWAPRIVLTAGMPDAGVVALQQRGFEFPTPAEQARDVLVKIGVDADAIEVLPDQHDATAHEAATLSRLAAGRGWRRVIVVTSKYHTRRTALAMRRAVAAETEVIVRSSRYDPSEPQYWWRSRGGVRSVVSETQKLVAYALGLGS